MPPREQRRLAAIVAADVVGYSRLMGRDEANTVARLRQIRAERLQPVLDRRGGRMVKLTGDGALVEFASAVEALSAAIEFQQAMIDSEAGQPEAERVVYRVGLHMGDVIVDDDNDLYGDGINVAARLEAEAPPGGIVVSSAIHDATANRLKATFVDLGPLNLKNIERPVLGFGVRWQVGDWPVAGADLTPNEGATAGRHTSSDSPPLPDKPSIAVLPFENMSGDPEQEYFADGIVEDITTALSRVPLFFVIARNSAFTYKGRAVDVRQIARELGVRYVLEGSVRKSGTRLRITGQLVDASTGNHLWADRYDGLLDDVFDLQDRITADVVGTIEPTVQQAEIRRAQRKPTGVLSAYDLYLRALACVHEAKEESLSEALRLLDEAIADDRTFSSAYGLKAICHVQRKAQGWSSIELAEGLGQAAAMLAIETGREDPNALARAGLALAYLGGNHREGLAQVERAKALNPNCALVARFGGYISWYSGEHERALAFFEQARRFSPVDPSMTEIYTGMGFPNFFLGRYEQAIDLADRTLRERANWGPAWWLKLAALASAHRPRDELRKSVENYLALSPDISQRAIMSRFPPAAPALRASFAQALQNAGLPQ